MKQRIAIQGSMAIVSAFILFFLSRFFVRTWLASPMDIFLNILGLVLVMTGFYIRISARGHKQEHSLASEALVRDGLYEYTRNPMYLGTFCLGTGSVLTILQPWVLLIFWAGYFSIYIPQVLKEERWLTDKFSGMYLDYCRQVPRIFPSFSRLQGFLWVLVPSRLNWFRKEAVSCSVVLMILLILQLTRMGTTHGLVSLIGEFLRFFAVVLLMALPVLIKIKGQE